MPARCLRHAVSTMALTQLESIVAKVSAKASLSMSSLLLAVAALIEPCCGGQAGGATSGSGSSSLTTSTGSTGHSGSAGGTTGATGSSPLGSAGAFVGFLDDSGAAREAAVAPDAFDAGSGAAADVALRSCGPLSAALEGLTLQSLCSSHRDIWGGSMKYPDGTVVIDDGRNADCIGQDVFGPSGALVASLWCCFTFPTHTFDCQAVPDSGPFRGCYALPPLDSPDSSFTPYPCSDASAKDAVSE